MATQKKVKSSPKALWIVLTIVVVVIAIILLTPKPSIAPQSTNVGSHSTSFDFDNHAVPLNNEELVFVDGIYESPSHTARMTSRYANESGSRAAVILVDSPEGSGSFSYVMGASLKDGNSVYSAPVLLGDRITIESVIVDDTSVIVKYLGHSANAPMAGEPTEQFTATYTFQDDGSLTLVQ